MMRTSDDETVDVVIVGYGPVGAVAANLLRVHGMSVLAADTHADVFPTPRAARLDDGALRLFATIGVLDRVTASVGASQTDGMKIAVPGGFTMPPPGVPAPATDELPQGHLREGWFVQPEIERALRAAAAERGVRPALAHEVVGIVQDDDGATVSLRARHDGTVREVRCRWVLGCDGAASFVRSAMGAEVEDLGYQQRILIVDADRAGDPELPLTPQLHLDPHRPYSYIPIGSRYARLEFEVLPHEDAAAVLHPDSIAALTDPWFRGRDVKILRSTVFSYRAQLALGWRSGRVFIAGDAAHTMAPWTGNGLLSGWRDVENLAWKLALVARGQGPDELLDTYESERSPHVRTFIEASSAAGRLMDGMFAQARRSARAFRRPGTTRRRPRLGEILLVAVALGRLAASAVPRRGQNATDADFVPGSMPQPVLGPGLRTGSPAPVGTPAPNPRLRDGSLLDDLTGPRFAVIGPVNVLGQVSAETRATWNRLDFAILDAVPDALRAWLAEHGAAAVVIRPDRQVLVTATTAGDLDRATADLRRVVLRTADAPTRAS